MTDFNSVFTARSRWAVALGSLPRETVLELGERFATQYEVTPVTVPQSGLALLTLRDSVERQRFYLGEAPLSISRVTISRGTESVEGAALLMADDMDLVSAIAICDGVLAHRWEGWQDVAEKVQQGIERLNHEARIRKTMLTRSRVNFSLLNEEDTPDDGAG